MTIVNGNEKPVVYQNSCLKLSNHVLNDSTFSESPKSEREIVHERLNRKQAFSFFTWSFMASSKPGVFHAGPTE